MTFSFLTKGNLGQLLVMKGLFLKLEEFLAALFHLANTNKSLSKSMVWYPILTSLLKTPSIYTFLSIIGTLVHKRKENF